MKASNQPPDKDLIKQRNEKLQQLEGLKINKPIGAEIVKLERQIAEMTAQSGDTTKLNQELIDKKARLQQLVEQNKSVIQQQKQLQNELNRSQQTYQEYQRTARQWIDRGNWSPELRSRLNEQQDPTKQLSMMIDHMSQVNAYPEDIMEKLEDLQGELDDYERWKNEPLVF